MARSESERMDLLNNYWDEAVRGAGAETSDIDPQLRNTVAEVHALDDMQSASPAFQQQLWQDLMSQAAATVPDRRGYRLPLPRPSHGFWGLTPRLSVAGLAVAIFFGVIIGAYFLASQPKPVSAEEIVRKAQEVAASPMAGGVRSFTSTERTTSVPSVRREEEYVGQTSRWYEAPNLWRIEETGAVFDDQGKGLPGRSWNSTNVSDGKNVWFYDAVRNVVQVNELGASASGKPDSYGGETTLGQETIDPQKALRTASPNVRPKLRGEETVAGRRAYVLDFPPETRSASVPDVNGPRTVWVDKETYFVLKVVQTSEVDGKVISTMEVTGIQYNVSIDPVLFSFTPPRGARVEDYRPKPAPTKGQFAQQMEALAKQASFPLFLPAQVPDGLVPRQPRMDTEMGLRLEYVPASEADRTASSTVRIVEQRATADLVSNWTERAESTAVGGAQAWLRRGTRNVDGTSTDSGVILLSDGTMISVSSFALTPEDLVKVAASMQRVPGGHEPLPNPAVPSRPSRPTPTPVPPPRFKVLRPTWLPEQMTAREQSEPDPTGKGTQVVIGFDPRPEDQRPHGVLMLTEMAEGAMRSGGRPDPEETRETIGGRDVKVIWRGENWITLTWEQDGVVLVLTNPYDPPGHPRYTPAQLSKVVESVR